MSNRRNTTTDQLKETLTELEAKIKDLVKQRKTAEGNDLVWVETELHSNRMWARGLRRELKLRASL